MKQSMFSKQGQKGFTLLELLIVVTIIAILSVGAILAYDGLTDKAQSATAANNNITADQSIRNFRAVTGNYPNQWDHLVVNDGGTGDALPFVAEETYVHLAKVDATPLSEAILEALDEVGIEEFQVRLVNTVTAGVEPNLQHNEGASAGDSADLELEDGDFPDRLVVIPTASSATFCTVGGAATEEIGTVDDSLIDQGATEAQNYMIKVNDALGEDECHLILAVGFGHDAAHSTVNSNVAIAAAPAFVSNDINPAQNYARYIALFDLGVDGLDGTAPDFDITGTEIYQKAKLIGMIDPEGNIIDENVAAANNETAQ